MQEEPKDWYFACRDTFAPRNGNNKKMSVNIQFFCLIQFIFPKSWMHHYSNQTQLHFHTTVSFSFVIRIEFHVDKRVVNPFDLTNHIYPRNQTRDHCTGVFYFVFLLILTALQIFLNHLKTV